MGRFRFRSLTARYRLQNELRNNTYKTISTGLRCSGCALWRNVQQISRKRHCYSNTLVLLVFSAAFSDELIWKVWDVELIIQLVMCVLNVPFCDWCKRWNGQYKVVRYMNLAPLRSMTLKDVLFNVAKARELRIMSNRSLDIVCFLLSSTFLWCLRAGSSFEIPTLQTWLEARIDSDSAVDLVAPPQSKVGCWEPYLFCQGLSRASHCTAQPTAFCPIQLVY